MRVLSFIVFFAFLIAASAYAGDAFFDRAGDGDAESELEDGEGDNADYELDTVEDETDDTESAEDDMVEDAELESEPAEDDISDADESVDTQPEADADPESENEVDLSEAAPQSFAREECRTECGCQKTFTAHITWGSLFVGLLFASWLARRLRRKNG